MTPVLSKGSKTSCSKGQEGVELWNCGVSSRPHVALRMEYRIRMLPLGKKCTLTEHGMRLAVQESSAALTNQTKSGFQAKWP